MLNVLKAIGAVVAGWFLGSVVNMGIVMLGPALVEPPPGADFSTLEGVRAAMPLMEPKHFLFPWLAHALGTLVGAFAAWKLGRSNRLAWGVGFLFFLGGVANVFMIGGPVWFNGVDLVLAYFPMAWLAIRVQRNHRR